VPLHLCSESFFYRQAWPRSAELLPQLQKDVRTAAPNTGAGSAGCSEPIFWADFSVSVSVTTTTVHSDGAVTVTATTTTERFRRVENPQHNVEPSDLMEWTIPVLATSGKLRRGPRRTSMNVTTIGLDSAKDVFQIHGADSESRPFLRRRLRRKEVAPFAMAGMTIVDAAVQLQCTGDPSLPTDGIPIGPK
jgi:hypothetical protein